MQVFAKGSGPECRKAVQELNLKRMEMGRLEEQKLEAAIIEEEENREMGRFAENQEEGNQHVLEGRFESVEVLGLGERSPLAPMQTSASGSRWEKFLPASTSAWEEDEDDLEEEIQGCDLCGENRPLRSGDSCENLENGLDGAPYKKSKPNVGKRKAIDAPVGSSLSSKWGKFSS